MNSTVQYLQKALQATRSERDQFFELAKALEEMVDEVSAVACAWALAHGQGLPSLTEGEVAKLVHERYQTGDA
jgi:hypothetical protein